MLGMHSSNPLHDPHSHHESIGSPPGDIGTLEREMTLRRDKRTHKQQSFFFDFGSTKIFRIFCRVECSEFISTDEMSSNRRRHCVWLAKQCSWIRWNRPKVPKMWTNEQKKFN